MSDGAFRLATVILLGVIAYALCAASIMVVVGIGRRIPPRAVDVQS